MDLRGLHEINTGLGDGLAAAFELIATPFVFGVLGHLLDRWLGTGPAFMFAFALVVLAYEVWKLVTRYVRQMDGLEASAKWARPNRSASGSVSDG